MLVKRNYFALAKAVKIKFGLSNAMLAIKKSAGVTPEVNLGEHVTCTPLPSANKAAHSGFETQKRHHQKSKTWVSVAPQKGLTYVLQIFI